MKRAVPLEVERDIKRKRVKNEERDTVWNESQEQVQLMTRLLPRDELIEKVRQSNNKSNN